MCDFYSSMDNPLTLQISFYCMYYYSYKLNRPEDEPYSRKQLKRETLKTTRKSSRTFSSEATSASPPRTISFPLSGASIGDPNAFTSTWPSSDRLPTEIWISSSLSLTSVTYMTSMMNFDNRIFSLPRSPRMFVPIYRRGWNENPDDNNNRCVQCKVGG